MFKNNTLSHYRSGLAPIWVVVNLILLISLSCSLPDWLDRGKPTLESIQPPTETPSLPTATPQPLPPALVETQPENGAEVPLDGEITLYFNQPMERSSVEMALQLEPTGFAELAWRDEATLILKPHSDLAPETGMGIRISSKARAQNGLEMLQPVAMEFHTPSYLRVAERIPQADAQLVDPASAVMVTFNRPVVALGAEQDTLIHGLTVAPLNEPKAQGEGEWVNTSTYIFYPQPALQGGKTYLVEVNSDLTSSDGSLLESAEMWSFTTAYPELVSFFPENNAERVRLDVQLKLEFNQPMDPASVESNLRILDGESKPINGTYTWQDNHTRVVFKPASLLKRNTFCQVKLAATTQALGGTQLGVPGEFVFQTTGAFGVVDTDPARGQQKRQYSSVILYLSAPIADDDLMKHVMINPAVANLRGWFDGYTNSIRFSGNFEPATRYTLVLKPDLQDIWGDKLDEEYLYEFVTAPLKPTLFLTTGNNVIFLTPQDTSLSAQAANLNSIPLSLGSVPLDDFIAMFGPDSYDFRRYYQSPDQVEWLQSLDLTPNKMQTINLPVHKDGKGLPPGLYYLNINSSETYLNSERNILVSSNINLTFKLSPTQAMVWAVDLRNNQPVSGAQVTILNQAGEPLALGVTDSEGIFTTDLPQLEETYPQYFAIVNQPGQENFALAMSDWSQGVGGYDFGLKFEFAPPRLEAYIYTDRPIYRPGQTVYFKAIVRYAYNGRYELPDMEALQGVIKLDLYGDRGQKLKTFTLPLSDYGSAQGEYTLPESAEPGSYYRISSEEIYPYDVNFQVAAYRKPEINLVVDISEEQAVGGDKINAKIDARYFFDAPAGNLDMHWVLYARDSYFYLPGYRVGLEDTSWMNAFYMPGYEFDPGTAVAEGNGRSDTSGLMELILSTQPTHQPSTYTLEVTAVDESGLPVSGRDEVDVHPADIYIGVKPDRWNARAGEQIGFDLQVVDWEKKPASVKGMTAVFDQVIWVEQPSTVEELYEGPQYLPQYTRIGSTDFSTNAQGQARLAFTPPSPGTYQLTLTGDGARTELLVWAGGAGQAVWPNIPNQRLQLTADRESYAPGETAEIFVPNPFGAPVTALVTLERSVVLRHQVITVDANGTTVSFALDDQDAPNAVLAVTLIGKRENGQPDFRQGYINLPVDPVANILNVSLTSQPQRTGPGDQVTFNLLVTDQANQPVQAEFSLSLVDLAVLALADPNVPDIVTAYYGEQPLGVKTGQPLTVYAHRKTLIQEGLGGGGGVGDVMPSEVRERFQDTAFWNAEVVTDAEGKAQVTVNLPDNLTTWEVDVRGLSADSQAGQAKIEVVTTKDLLVRPVTPRFLTVGDHVQLAAVVHNNTSANLPVQVSLQVSGVVLDQDTPADQQVDVAAGSRVRVEWWAQVEEVDSVDLVFRAVSGLLQDASRPAGGVLPVLRYTAPQAFVTSGVLDEAGERLELVSLPRSGQNLGGSLSVELAPSLVASMMTPLEKLEQYPYECTEQVLARFLPNLELYTAMRKYGLESPELQARLERTLEDNLADLLARQNTDGGWGWWQGGKSDAYISAYVLHGLLRVRESAAGDPAVAIQKGLDYLVAGLVSPQMLNKSWQLNRLAFSAYVLSRTERGDIAMLNGLFQDRERLDPWAQAFLALGLETLSPGSQSARTLLADLQASVVRTGSGAFWQETTPTSRNMYTPVSTTAVVVYALATQDPASPLLADATRYLTAHRMADNSWGSTFASAWTMTALTKVMEGTGELAGDFKYSATLNGTIMVSGDASGAHQLHPASNQVDASQLYAQEPNALVIERQVGNGRLYYQAALRVNQPVELVSAQGRGLSIQRAYHDWQADCRVDDCTPLESAEAGKSLRVRLTLTLQNDAYYLVVEDHLPAGAEVLDTSLRTSQQGYPAEEVETLFYDPSSPFVKGWGWWYFSQPKIYDERIVWAADYLPAGTYELTYTLVLLQPGEYRVIPAQAWQFYFPDVCANGEGTIFEIK